MLTLSLLLSSSNSLKYLFNEVFFIDFLDRFLTLNYNFFSNLSVNFNLKLPFKNSLLKFKNKVSLVLNFLIFELIVGFKPQIIPVFNNKNSQPVLKNLKRIKETLLRDVLYFKFLLVLPNFKFFHSLFLLHIFVSKNTYMDFVVASKIVKLDYGFLLSGFNYAKFIFKSGITIFEFFNNFNDVVAVKNTITFDFNFKGPNGFFLLQALGLNVFNKEFRFLNTNKFYFLNYEKKL